MNNSWIILGRLDQIEQRILEQNLLIRGLVQKMSDTQKELDKMSAGQNALDTQIAQLTAQVANDTTVEGSAITLLNSIPTLIQNAINTALANGATPAELAALSGLSSTLTANATNLAAAVTANTPAAAPTGSAVGGSAVGGGAASPSVKTK